MKHWWIVLFSLLAISCHDDSESPKTTWKHVAIVYIMGENSLTGYTQFDLNEMRRSMGSIPDSCKLAVFFDNARREQPSQIIIFDNQNEKVLYEYKEDPVSTDNTVFYEALKTIIKKYPARHYGLTMWSHGSGWIPAEPRRTIGIDNRNNTSSDIGVEMEITGMSHALRQLGIVCDYILFDACFMQCVEVAYELRDVTRWCIASPAEIPAEGAPYDQLMPDLFLPEEDCWRIAENYFDYYKERGGLVISAIQTSELETLAAATAPLMREVEEFPSTLGIQKYFAKEIQQQWRPEYHDMGSAMHQWLSEQDFQTWLTAANRAVPHHYATDRWRTAYYFVNAKITDTENNIGISMYIPTEDDPLNEPYAQTAWGRRVKD